MSDPGCSGTLARLRDEFGAGSVAIDNAITLLFAGFDTTSSSITFMLALLGGQHPGVLKKVKIRAAAGVATPRGISGLRQGIVPTTAMATRTQVAAEQAEVVGKHGDAFTPAAYAAMPYTLAVVKESLRLAAIIAYVPRLATQELHVPHGPTLPAGCPFIMALAALGASDPALQTSSSSGHGAEEGGQAFRPER
jgi:cytochrome P450